MNKKPEILTDGFGDAGNLCINWYPGPHGDAVDDLTEKGIGFFAPNGELLSVEFDDINYKQDHQVLEFPNYRVEVTIKKGKVTVKLHAKKRARKKVA